MKVLKLLLISFWVLAILLVIADVDQYLYAQLRGTSTSSSSSSTNTNSTLTDSTITVKNATDSTVVLPDSVNIATGNVIVHSNGNLTIDSSKLTYDAANDSAFIYDLETTFLHPTTLELDSINSTDGNIILSPEDQELTMTGYKIKATTEDDGFFFSVDSASALRSDSIQVYHNYHRATVTLDSLRILANQDGYRVILKEIDPTGADVNVIDTLTASTSGAGEWYYSTATSLDHAAIDADNYIFLMRPDSTGSAHSVTGWGSYTKP